MKYRLKHKEVVIAENLGAECLECMARYQKDKNISTKESCSQLKENCRTGLFEKGDSQLFFCAHEKRDVDSRRRFKDKVDAFFFVSEKLQEINKDASHSANIQTSRLTHNLVSLNAHAMQEVYEFFPQKKFSRNIKEQRKRLSKAIKSSPDKAANVIVRLLKASLQMKVEFDVHDFLYNGGVDFSPREHELKSVILNVAHIFFLDFSDRGVVVNVEQDEVRAIFDYDLFSVAVSDILDNAT
jgi:hypothetical protein